MTEFFAYSLFSLGDYNFTVLNLVLLVTLILIAKNVLARTKKYIKRVLPETEILKIEGRKITLVRLFTQLVFIFFVFLIIESLTLNNPKFSIIDFITLDLLKIKDFTLSVYHFFLIVAVIQLSKIAINLIKLFLSRASKKTDKLDESTQYVLLQLAKYFIYVFGILFIIQSFGISITLLFYSSAGLLVGVGLGFQDFFRDIVSGFILLFDTSIKVGDIIEVGNEKLVAKVLKISLRTTKIETRDGNYMIIPNSKITQDYVHNWSFGSPLTRFKIEVSVAYGSDAELVKKLLIQAAQSHSKVSKKNPIIVRLLNFGDNGLEMDLVFWADQSWEIEIVKSEIRFEIDRLFRENRVVIPFPQRDVHHINQP